jgi:ATP-dependent protease ClpP protease subunit
MRILSYFIKHWRGDFSLAVSFWINVLLINLAISIFQVWLTKASPIENPVLGSQVTIIYVFMVLATVYPWQIIGLWRSANRHIQETNRRFWPGVVKVLVVIGLLGTLGRLAIAWPVYADLYHIGFGKDVYGVYRVELTNDGTLIHLEGGLGFGISKEIKRMIDKNPNVKGIILDSSGGRIYEGRELSEIILIHSLDTYTLKGCYSACGTAFISGKKRYLVEGANLAFHQYATASTSLEPYFNLPDEQRKDLMIYQKQEIGQDFIDRIFKAANDDLWYPTIDEMLNAGVVHQIVNPSSLKPVKYYSYTIGRLDEDLSDNSSFQAIKKYEPEIYLQILHDMDTRMKEGASQIEIQQLVNTYINSIAVKALPKTSNQALVAFTRETVNMLRMLNEMDPILCMKNILPDQYGPLVIENYLTGEQLRPMNDALNLVIADSHNKDNEKTDAAAAEEFMGTVMVQLGDDARYLAAKGLQNTDEYSRSCNAVIRFYELILSNNEQVAGNGLRYTFSPQ